MNDVAVLTNIPLAEPGPGQSIDFVIAPGHTYTLGFELASAEVGQEGDSLHIGFENGGTLHLQKFFSSSQEGGVILVLPDGTSVDARDLVDALLMPLEEFVPHAEGLFSGDWMPQDEPLLLEDLLEVSAHPSHAGAFSSPLFISVTASASLSADLVSQHTVTSSVSMDTGVDMAEDLLAVYLHTFSL